MPKALKRATASRRSMAARTYRDDGSPLRRTDREGIVMAEVFGERRKQLLRHLLRNKTGATIKELMQVLGVTRTAVRQHVAALIRQGLVAPAAVLPSGGRPRTLFALTSAGREAVPR